MVSFEWSVICVSLRRITSQQAWLKPFLKFPFGRCGPISMSLAGRTDGSFLENARPNSVGTLFESRLAIFAEVLGGFPWFKTSVRVRFYGHIQTGVEDHPASCITGIGSHS